MKTLLSIDWRVSKSRVMAVMRPYEERVIGVRTTPHAAYVLNLMFERPLVASGVGGGGREEREKLMRLIVTPEKTHGTYRVIKFLMKDKQIPVGVDKLAIYRSTPKIDELAKEMKMEVMVAPWKLRQKYEDKVWFRELLKRLKIPSFEGEVMMMMELKKMSWDNCQNKWGKRVVFQLVDEIRGGGSATYIVKNEKKYESFVNEGVGRVLCMKFVEGFSTAISGCVTRCGIVVDELRKQVIGATSTISGDGGGKYCGNSWGEPGLTKSVREQTYEYVKKLGQEMAKDGYRGLFGVDLRVDREGRVCVGECNARLTGSYPVATMIAESDNLLPIEVLHYLELLGIDYQFDLHELNQKYLVTSSKAAHLVLHNRWGKDVLIEQELHEGVYRYNNEKCEYLRKGYRYQDIESDDEFVLTDGLPAMGEVVVKGARIGKIIFAQSIMGNVNGLCEFGERVVNWVYGQWKSE